MQPWLQFPPNTKLEDLEDEPKRPRPKWYYRLSFWGKAWPVLATVCLLIAAALLRRFGPDQVLSGNNNISRQLSKGFLLQLCCLFRTAHLPFVRWPALLWSLRQDLLLIKPAFAMPLHTVALADAAEIPTCVIVSMQKIKHLEWWRLCFFLSTLAPICWVTSLAVKLLVMAVESQLFIAKNVLYFMAAVKVMRHALPSTNSTELCDLLITAAIHLDMSSLAVLHCALQC